MRRYAKDMAAMAEARRSIEAMIRKEHPTLKPSAVRSTAKALALVAYRNLKAS